MSIDRHRLFRVLIYLVPSLLAMGSLLAVPLIARALTLSTGASASRVLG